MILREMIDAPLADVTNGMLPTRLQRQWSVDTGAMGIVLSATRFTDRGEWGVSFGAPSNTELVSPSLVIHKVFSATRLFVDDVAPDSFHVVIHDARKGWSGICRRMKDRFASSIGMICAVEKPVPSATMYRFSRPGYIRPVAFCDCGQCRVCKLSVDRPEYAELLARSHVVIVDPPRPCKHEGAVLEWCHACGDTKHVRDCDIHERCTRIPVSTLVRSCSGCKDYVPVT